jgi:DNA-binding beta-propeller fold protein YncE
MRSIGSWFKAVLILMIMTSISISAAEKNRKGSPVPKQGDLVWPLPPDQPRVRFLQAIVGEEDFTGKTKVSFAQRLMGKSVEDKIFLRQPYGIAVGDGGRIFVADTIRQEIVVFDKKENSVYTWNGNRRIALAMPIGLAIDSNSRLFVSDSKGAQVAVFGPNGDPIAALKDVVKRPVGLAVDNRLGRLYVGDLELSKILVYDLKTLKVVKQIENDASKPFEISAPTNMAVSRNGDLFVSDTKKCQITVFNSAGEFVRSFGTMGDSPGQFARPKGIALDSEGHVYVVDSAFGNFQIFTQDGKLLLAVGKSGQQPGEMTLPAGIAIDNNDTIYVTEQWLGHGRLQIFQYLRSKNQTAADNAR